MKCHSLKYSLTVLMGFRRGISPKEYWKNPRPTNAAGAIPVVALTHSWKRRNFEPGGLGGWSNRSSSPKLMTGTSAVPVFNAIRQNPLRFFSTSWKLLGRQFRDSAAPPTSRTTAFDVYPSLLDGCFGSLELVKRWVIPSEEQDATPQLKHNSRNTGTSRWKSSVTTRDRMPGKSL